MKISDFIIEAKVLVETRTPSQILLELNVINIPQIDSYLSDIAQNFPTKETQKWFISRAKKYLINSEDDNSIITSFTNKAEPWMKKRQKEGVALYSFSPSAELTTKFTHIIDWIRTMNDISTGVKRKDQQVISQATRALKGLNNTSIPQAIEASEKWVRDMNAELLASEEHYDDSESSQSRDGEPVMTYGDYTWVKLTNSGCLDKEGARMGHCVATYSRAVKSGESVIYSLRDVNNKPHATIEIKEGELNQVKGKSDKPPIIKYQPATIAFLNTLNVPPSNLGMSDIRTMFFLYNEKNNKYGNLKDIGEVVYNKDGIKVYSTGSISEASSDSPAWGVFHGNNTIATYMPEKNYNRAQLKVNTTAQMDNIVIDGALYDNNIYRIAKLLCNINIQIPGNTSLNEIDAYAKAVGYRSEGGSLIMKEETMPEVVFTSSTGSNKTIRRNTNIDGKMREQLMVFIDGKSNEIFSKETEKSRGRTVYTRYRDYQGDDLTIFIEYINSLSENSRPVLDGKDVFQHTDTLYTSTKLLDVTKSIAKSGGITSYKIYPSKFVILNRMLGPSFILSVSENKPDTFNRDLKLLRDANKEDLTKVMNKTGFGEMFPFTVTQFVREFEDNGIYFLRGKKKFTTDFSISGEKYKHEDEGFDAIKTHNGLRIYYNTNEIARFKLTSEIKNGETDSSIADYEIKDRLAVLNNASRIADVLSHYKITKDTTRGWNSNVADGTNKNLTQSGLSYSVKNGWKGMKSGTKFIEDNKVNKQEYEIHSFKHDFLIKDKTSHKLIATFKGTKDKGDPIIYIDNVIMDSNDELVYDMAIDALHQLNAHENISVALGRGILRGSNPYGGHEIKNHFQTELHNRGYNADNEWFKITDTYPIKEISKGTGGTWVKEAYTTGVDDNILRNQKQADRDVDDYSGRKRSDSISDVQHVLNKEIKKYHNNVIRYSDDTYTLYNKTKPILRAITSKKTLVAVYHIEPKPTTGGREGYKTKLLNNKELLMKFSKPIVRLLQKLQYASGAYLSDFGLYYTKGKMKDVSSNPKLIGFMNGKIVYEDGHKWIREEETHYHSYATSGSTEWYLTIPLDNNKVIKNAIVVTVSDAGMEGIKFQSEKVRKNTKLYRAFLNDLMDISDEIYGAG